jgi:hypothetical protein
MLFIQCRYDNIQKKVCFKPARRQSQTEANKKGSWLLITFCCHEKSVRGAQRWILERKNPINLAVLRKILSPKASLTTNSNDLPFLRRKVAYYMMLYIAAIM